MSIFKVKQTIPASEKDVEIKRILISPPSIDSDTNTLINGKINFGVKGVSPVSINKEDWNVIEGVLMKIAGNVQDFKEFTKKEIPLEKEVISK